MVACRAGWRAVPLVAAGFVAPIVLAAGPDGSAGGADRPFAGRIDVTAVTVLLDVRDSEGQVPQDLTVADFEVIEDGQPQTVLAVEPLNVRSPDEAAASPAAGERGPGVGAWQVVIFFDQRLASRRGSREAALGLAAAAEDLTRLGLVQIVAANSGVEEILAPTRDSEALRGALLRAAKKTRGHEELVKIRRQFLRDFQGGATEQEQIVAISGARSGGGAASPVDRTADGEARERMLIRSALRQEMEIVGRQSDVLAAWAKRDRRLGPRLLLLVHDGFDAEPRDFYLGMASSGVESAIGSELTELSLGPVKQRLTRLLSAQGWTVYPLAVGRQQTAGLNTVEESGAAGASHSDRLGVLRRAPSFLQGQALGPLLSLAEESGGTLLTDEAALPRELTRLSERIRLDYQVARPPDGQIHRLEVRAKRPGLRVATQRWVASETLEEVALGRAVRLAQGEGERGELPLASMVVLRDAKGGGAAEDKRQGTLATRVDLAPLADARPLLTATAMRVSLVIFFTDREPFVHHQLQTDQDLSLGEEWKHALTMSFPDAVARVVVVVEELATGTWGGAVAPLVRR